MLRLDRNDPLDRMIIQELNGEPVLFDQWLDAMDELEEEPECAEILEEKGLRREDVLEEARAYRTGFRARLADRGLPVDDRFLLCQLLSEQAQAEPSVELLRIYAEILCDPGLLLDEEPQPEDEEDRPYCEDQMILQYLSLQEDRDQLMQILAQIGELAGKFVEVKKQKCSPRPVDCDTSRKDEILQCFLSLYEMPKRGKRRKQGKVEVLLDNLSHYIQIAAASPVLKSVEPLFLFLLLTLRQSYMCSNANLQVDIDKLWIRQESKVDEDNGKNFKKYRKDLDFFEALTRIYEKDSRVDLPLCWYGLDQLTVLGEFYRNEVLCGVEFVDVPTLPLLPTIENLVDDALFSCFENGAGDNLLFIESGLDVKALNKFQFSDHPIIIHALDRISDYIADHAVQLAEQFLQAGPEDVKAMCRKILEKSKIKSAVSERDLPLYLAVINGNLMELQDFFAGQHLIQAGCALTNGPLMKNPGLNE